MNANRRTSARAKVDLLINRFIDGRPNLCRVTDISPTGMRLHPIREPKGAPRFIGLQFQVPGADTVFTASGEVMNASPGGAGTGIRFTSVTSECASLIRRLVEAN
jgi:hypothetical protein